MKKLKSKSPAAIRKTTKSRDIQRSLFRSASSLFEALGYAGVSIRDIVAAVNVPKGTFYNYFRSKEYLASMIVRGHFEGLALTLAASDNPSAALRLRRHFEAISISGSLTASPGLFLGTLTNELLGLPESLSAQIRAGFRSRIDQVTHLLRLAQAQRHVSTEHNPRQLAEFLLDSWQGAMLATKRDSSVASLDNFLHLGFDPLVNSSESIERRGSSVSCLIRAEPTKKADLPRRRPTNPEKIELYHRPLVVVLAFADELGRRLGGIPDNQLFVHEEGLMPALVGQYAK